MGGLQASDLVILAGRPGMGKTALATNIAFNIAKAYRGETRADGTQQTIDGGIVGFFSLEMSAEQLATRIIAEQSGVASYKIRRGDITETDFHHVAEAVREMQSIPFFIDQTGGISIAQLTARARRLKRQRGLDLLVIDYIQLLSGSKTRGDNRVQELTEITTGLKALAKELNVPILALSQLSRQVEQRDDKRPQLSDLQRIRLDRAGRRRRDVRLSRGILPQEQGAAPRLGRARRLDERNGARARPRRGDHRQTAPWADGHGGIAVRGRTDAIRQSRARGGDAGDPVSGRAPTPAREPPTPLRRRIGLGIVRMFPDRQDRREHRQIGGEDVIDRGQGIAGDADEPGHDIGRCAAENRNP